MTHTLTIYLLIKNIIVEELIDTQVLKRKMDGTEDIFKACNMFHSELLRNRNLLNSTLLLMKKVLQKHSKNTANQKSNQIVIKKQCSLY